MLPNCSGRHQEPQPESHPAPPHSEPVQSALRHSVLAQPTDPQPARLIHLMQRRLAEEPAVELVLQAGLCSPPSQQSSWNPQPPAIEDAVALPEKQGLHKELQPKKKPLNASTHQSFGQYPSLCAIQQRGSFRSPNRWVCFQDKSPRPSCSCHCPERGFFHCAHNPLD